MNKKMICYGFIILLMCYGMLIAQTPRGEGRMQRMEKALDLTEAQESQIMDLRLQLQKELISLQSEQQKLQADLKIEMTAEKFNEAKLKKTVEQISDIRMQIQLKRLLHQRAIRNLLTEEQRKEFDLHVLSREPRGQHRGPRDFHRPQRSGPPQELLQD